MLRRGRRNETTVPDRVGSALPFIMGVAAVAALMGGSINATEILLSPPPRRSSPALPEAVSSRLYAPGALDAVLLYGTRGGHALWLTLLAHNPRSGSGLVLYIPANAAAEVPGRGLQGLAGAHDSGGPELLTISTRNLLGVPVHDAVELSRRDAEALFGATGAMPVTVPAAVSVPEGDGARPIFAAGRGRLSPERLAKLLFSVGVGEDDVDLGARHLALWQSLLRRYHGRPPALEDAALQGLRRGRGAGATAAAAALLKHLAGLPAADLSVANLPVRQLGVGRNQLYPVDSDDLSDVLEETLEVDSEFRPDVDVQVLNGNGVPGIGEEIARRLVGRGYRVALSGNAERLNHPRTLIVTYDGSRRGRAVAARARRLLGVGEIQVAAGTQGIVDLSIVVGEDFSRKG